MTPLLPQVNTCRVKLLTAVASTDSPCFSSRISFILCGTANFLGCQGKASGLFHETSKSSASQHLRRGNSGVTGLPVSPFAQREAPSKPYRDFFSFSDVGIFS